MRTIHVVVSALALAVVVIVSGVDGAAAQGDPRQVCQNDALSLCGEFVPDEQKITACMIRKHRQVSAECRAAMAHGGGHGRHEGRRHHRHCRHCD
jgi:hypothetical protein